MKKNNEDKVKLYVKKNSLKVYFLVIVFCVMILSVILYKTYNKEEKYLVNEGVIEYTTSNVGYVIKDETIINIDNTKVLIPTISEGSRVSKTNIIATYKGAEYENYQTRLQELDAQILDAMQDINIEYSVDVNNIETQVVNAIVAAQGISSMVEMQECRTNINNLLSKRAGLIGELSPEDAYVKQLISQREKLENELKTSTSNIKATIGGIVSYSVDGLEDKLTEETIETLNYEDVKQYVKSGKNLSTNKIRITSNYEAYILIRVDNVEKERIVQGKTYEIRVMGEEVNTLKGKITKITETEQGYEVLFRFTNGVENLVDSRECEIEVVWTTYEGLVVPVSALNKSEDNKTYVKIITRGEYIDIPVKVEQKNKTYAIVSNYEKENVNDYILERYDQVVLHET